MEFELQETFEEPIIEPIFEDSEPIDSPVSVEEVEEHFEVIEAESLDVLQPVIEDPIFDDSIAVQLLDNSELFIDNHTVYDSDHIILLYEFSFIRSSNTYSYTFEDNYDTVLVYFSLTSPSSINASNFITFTGNYTLISEISNHYTSYYVTSFVYRLDNVRAGDTVNYTSNLSSYVGTSSIFNCVLSSSDQPDYLAEIYNELNLIDSKLDNIGGSSVITATDFLSMDIENVPVDIALIFIALMCFLSVSIFNFITKRF